MNHDHYGNESDVSSKQPPWWPGLLAVLVMAAIALICVFSIGCATTTFYENGKPITRFQGNMSGLVFTRSPDGSISWTAKSVSHSKATLAGGRAISSVTVPAASVLTANKFLP